MQDKAASRSTMISADTDGFLGHPPGSYKDNRYGKAGTGWKGPGLGDEGGGGGQDGNRTEPGRTAELLTVPKKISRIIDRNSDHKALSGALSCPLSLALSSFPFASKPSTVSSLINNNMTASCRLLSNIIGLILEQDV